MRTIMVLMFLSFWLSVGCTTTESGPLPEETAAESVGEVEQAVNTPCFQDCHCPLGERCGANYYCESYAVWGGDTNPLKCVNNCQCHTYWSPGYFCHMDSGSYGHCKPY